MTSDYYKKFSHSQRERFICVYPAYMNSRRTLAEGRKVPTALAVDNPTVSEIKDVCLSLGFNVGVENKMYPRERDKEPLARGRVRVQFRTDDGTPVNPEVPSRVELLRACCRLIPKLKTRLAGGGGKPTEGAGGAGGGGPQGKKNKKKKR